MDEEKYYAHTLPQVSDRTQWEELETHLDAVAELASEFAAAFGSADWGRLAGQLHDVGKYQPAFQAYLRRCTAGDESFTEDAAANDHPGKVDHSTLGAQLACRLPGDAALLQLVAWCIASHHAGLLDAGVNPGTFGGRLRKDLPSCDIPVDRRSPTVPSSPALVSRFRSSASRSAVAFRYAFWTRMLFSALVDADYLCTERFMDGRRAAGRPIAQQGTIEAIRDEVDRFIDQTVTANARPSVVNDARQRVLSACRQAATQSPGYFTLTVPTGGGKTLSSMSFALRHAAAHGLRRVIYAIPFTSIIEQNAAKFREALGAFAEHLIEHHSNRDPDAASQAEQLASENWDAEIVVTTNVQLLESLFASKTSQCRKLHRIANSVIVLDEAQTLPVDLLEPTLRALEALVTDYGCSIVLCTATQPAITRREGFEIGLPIPAEREIAGTSAEVQNLFGALRRTRVQMGGALADDELVTRLIDQQQVLCIVNTKSHCADLYDGLAARLRDREGVFHLSTFMCPAHRTETLNTIRARLHASLPCRVISTSLIEAGVDIDFPVVFRARAGLDSILQAAGRCNREGKRDLGHVMVFDTDQQNPQLAQAQFAVADVLLTHGDRLDSPEAIEAYFRNWLFRESGHAKTRSSWDRKRIMDCFDVGSAGWEFQFRRAAADYRLIPQEQIRVVVPFDDTARQLISALNAMPKAPGRAFHRRLQKYAVSLSEWNLHRLDREGRLEPQNHSGIRVLREGTDAYDPLRGLRLGGPDDPDRLTV